MIDEQLRPRGIHDERVLAAMGQVPREAFVPDDLRHEAYHDCALAIGLGQTISQPFTVAYMCQALELRGAERVLEIGAGSGYGAAVLSELAREVYTVERIGELAEEAERRLQRLGYDNVHVRSGDGTLGWPEQAPFDAVVVTAAAESIPEALVGQLCAGGRLVIPVGEYGSGQRMQRLTLHDGRLTAEDLGAFSFVPLIGDDGRQT